MSEDNTPEVTAKRPVDIELGMWVCTSGIAMEVRKIDLFPGERGIIARVELESAPGVKP